MQQPLKDLQSILLKSAESAADPVRLKYAAQGNFLVALFSTMLIFFATQMSTEQARSTLFLLGLAITFMMTGILILGMAYMTAEANAGRPPRTKTEVLVYSLSNFSGAVGAPALFMGGVVLALFLEALLFSIGKIDSFGEIFVALLFMPFLLINVGLGACALVGLWLGAAAVVGQGVGGWAAFKSVAQLLRAHAVRIVPFFLFLFLLTALFASLYWFAIAVSFSITLWTAQTAVGGMRLALVTGLPQMILGALGPFGGVMSGWMGGSSLSMQLASLIFLSLFLLVAAGAAAYPFVFLSQAAYMIYESHRDAIQPIVRAPYAAAAASVGTDRFYQANVPPAAKCPKCFADLDPASIFCGSCGTRVGR